MNRISAVHECNMHDNALCYRMLPANTKCMLRDVNWMTSMRILTGNDRYINLKKEEYIYIYGPAGYGVHAARSSRDEIINARN